MKKVLILFLIVIGRLNAQPPTKFYTKFGGNGDDIGYSAKTTLDKQYIIAGSTTSFGNGQTDIYLVKLDTMGNTIWQFGIGGYNNEVGKSVVQLPDSGYVVVGFTNSYGAGGYDAYIVKTDKNGSMVWQQTFGGVEWDFANDVTISADGALIVVGYTSSFGSGKKDGFVLKYDFLGSLIWKKFFGGEENEELRSVIKTNDNFLATVGYTESRKDVNGDGYFMKLDLNGDTIFTKTFGGPYKDYANDVVQKSNDEYYMCGAKTYTQNSVTHSYMHKISSNGQFLLDSSYKRGALDESYWSLANSNHLPNFTGFVRSVPFSHTKMQGELFVTYHNFFYYKINDFGNGYEDEFAYSLEGTKDGGYISTGSTQSFGSTGMDAFFIKLDSVISYYSTVAKVLETSYDESFLVAYQEDGITVFCSNNEVDHVNIYDLDGRLIQEFNEISDSFYLSNNQYFNSIYILKVFYNNGRIRNKRLIFK